MAWLDPIAQGADGIVTLALNVPRQAYRTFSIITPEDRISIIKKLGLGNDMETYFFDNPQLFKMPKPFTVPGPALTDSPIARGASSIGAFEEGTLTKAVPWIAMGIAGIIAYNMFFRKTKRRKNPRRKRRMR